MIAGIIGAGVIGGGWAARFALMGWDVCIFDPSKGAKQRFEAVYANACDSLPGLYEYALTEPGTITWCSTLEEAVEHAQWVQESTPEQLALKHTVLKAIQKHCQADAIVASSTSGFKPSDLQAGSDKPEQIIVAHPFNPVYLLPLVETVGNPATCDKAKTVLQGIGMEPLFVAQEIDAHIADRFLEAVWREALWLVNDGIADTTTIDNAIRYGFGLRWAQMGLFETYRLAGGDAGMAHFIAQFGPALQWPWTKLMDVPELTPELIDAIASQSDAQSGHYSIRELERIRDDNLVSIMRALKPRQYGAGALLKAVDETLKVTEPVFHEEQLVTVHRVIPIDWIDYNGHMNESRYAQVFSDAADTVLQLAGADEAYVASGGSFFTVDCHIQYRQETHVGEAIRCLTVVAPMDGKKLRLKHEMRRANDETLLASAEQVLVHVDMNTRKSSNPPQHIVDAIQGLNPPC
jgi:carnitine 3-dehydrogenase